MIGLAGFLTRILARVEPRHWAGVGASAALHLAVILGWQPAPPPEPEPISFEVTFEPEPASRLPMVKPRKLAKKAPPEKVARKAKPKKLAAKKSPKVPREAHLLDAAWQAERKPVKDAPQLALPDAKSLGIQAADALALADNKPQLQRVEASASTKTVDTVPLSGARTAGAKTAENGPELVEPQAASVSGEQGQPAVAGLALANSTSLSGSQNLNAATSGAGAQANTSEQAQVGAPGVSGAVADTGLSRTASPQAALNTAAAAGLQASTAEPGLAASDSHLPQGVRLAVSGVLSSVAGLPAGSGALSSVPQATGWAQGGAQVVTASASSLAASGAAATGVQPTLPGARKAPAGGSAQQAGLSDGAASRGGRGQETPGRLGTAVKSAGALPGGSRPANVPGRSGQVGTALALAPGAPGSGPDFAVALQPVIASLANPYMPLRPGQSGAGGSNEAASGAGGAAIRASLESSGKGSIGMLNTSTAAGKAVSPSGQRNLAFNTLGGPGGVGSAPGQNASAAILNAARESGRPTVVLQATQPPAVKVVRPDSEIQRLDILAPSNYCPLPLPGHSQPDNRAPQAAHEIAERPAYSPDNPSINYPVLANIRGVEGRVTVRVEVLQDGRPGKMWLKQSSGSGILDQNAQEQLKQWRFVPARKNGQPVTAWIDVPVLYRLSQSRP